MKDNVTKLYGFIAKLMTLLENDIVFLEDPSNKNTVSVKKNIADILGKLVTLLVQLNKISKEEDVENDNIIAVNDENIINLFLDKYNSKSDI